MLDIAIKHSDELKEKLCGIWFENKYKYYNYNIDYEVFEPDKETWNNHQFVSLDNEGNVIGYISYSINRRTYNACGFGAINFSDNKITFGMDLGQVLKDIFEKFKFNKLSFCVVINNPIEKSYDKMIKKYNGRIVGIEYKETKLMDGEYYDVKKYEILRDDYMKTVHNHRK